jgi:hypothetical protein
MQKRKNPAPSKKNWERIINHVFVRCSVDFWISVTALILSISALLMKVFAK